MYLGFWPPISRSPGSVAIVGGERRQYSKPDPDVGHGAEADLILCDITKLLRAATFSVTYLLRSPACVLEIEGLQTLRGRLDGRGPGELVPQAGRLIARRPAANRPSSPARVRHHARRPSDTDDEQAAPHNVRYADLGVTGSLSQRLRWPRVNPASRAWSSVKALQGAHRRRPCRRSSHDINAAIAFCRTFFPCSTTPIIAMAGSRC